MLGSALPNSRGFLTKHRNSVHTIDWCFYQKLLQSLITTHITSLFPTLNAKFSIFCFFPCFFILSWEGYFLSAVSLLFLFPCIFMGPEFNSGNNSLFHYVCFSISSLLPGKRWGMLAFLHNSRIVDIIVYIPRMLHLMLGDTECCLWEIGVMISLLNYTIAWRCKLWRDDGGSGEIGPPGLTISRVILHDGGS